MVLQVNKLSGLNDEWMLSECQIDRFIEALLEKPIHDTC